MHTSYSDVIKSEGELADYNCIESAGEQTTYWKGEDTLDKWWTLDNGGRKSISIPTKYKSS